MTPKFSEKKEKMNENKSQSSKVLMSLKSLTVESEIALGFVFFAVSLSTAHSGPGLNLVGCPLLGARLGHCVITHLCVFRKYLNLKLYK